MLADARLISPLVIESHLHEWAPLYAEPCSRALDLSDRDSREHPRGAGSVPMSAVSMGAARLCDAGCGSK